MKLFRFIRIQQVVMLIVFVIFLLSPGREIYAQGPSIKDLASQYQQTKEKDNQKDILKQLSKIEPTTQDDVAQLRQIFSMKEWDEAIFAAAIESMKMIRKPELDTNLIEILKDEKVFVDKALKKDLSGKSEREVSHRTMNIIFIIQKLGAFKSKSAVAILKEYLEVPAFEYEVSRALASIGDKSLIEKIKEKVYKGAHLNYAGHGFDEAMTVINDLQDKGKKTKWRDLSGQLLSIRDKKTKPYLKQLFNHEEQYVIDDAATAFANIADEGDYNDIIEMTKAKNWAVRTNAIDVMKRLRTLSFEDTLIDLLNNDKHHLVRDYAAKTIGYKKLNTSFTYTKAIPYLEKALKDRDIEVRREAFIALYILTGKKYDFEGRDDLINWKAEDQSKHPSFW